MIYFHPNDTIQIEDSWTPSIGWHPHFSISDKIQYTNFYFFFKKKGYSDRISETMSSMILYKQKYKISYTVEQEYTLQKSLCILFTRKKH